MIYAKIPNLPIVSHEEWMHRCSGIYDDTVRNGGEQMVMVQITDDHSSSFGFHVDPP